MKRCVRAGTHCLGSTLLPRPYQRSASNTAAKDPTLLEKIEKGLGNNANDNPLRIDPTSKTIMTAYGSLPISPLMDPAWMEARGRFRTGKPKAKEAVGRFRELLSRNPYAHALATPFRHCMATHAGLPRYFLEDFILVEHPQTGKPWWVPNGLTLPIPASSSGTTETIASRDGDTEAVVGAERTDKAVTATPLAKATRNPSSPRVYLISRKPLYTRISSHAKTRYTNRHVSFLGNRGKYDSRFGKSTVWRRDMDDFVLDLMRSRVVQHLIYFLKRDEEVGRKYLRPCASWNEIKDLDHRGCVLWYSASKSGGSEDKAGPEINAPGEYATMDIPGKQYGASLPVHNLDYLLGEKHLGDLRESPVFRDGNIVLLGRRPTIGLQLMLWRIQGYLASYGHKVNIDTPLKKNKP